MQMIAVMKGRCLSAVSNSTFLLGCRLLLQIASYQDEIDKE